MFEAAEIKSQITNESASTRLRQSQAYLKRFGNVAGGMIGMPWDGCSKLEIGQIMIPYDLLLQLLLAVNERLEDIKCDGIEKLNHSDIRLVWNAPKKPGLVLDLNVDGVVLPIFSFISGEPKDVLERYDGIAPFVDDIIRSLGYSFSVRDAIVSRDLEMHECMAEAAARWDNPDLAVWLRMVPQYANLVAWPSWDQVRYEFCIEMIDDTLAPGMACADVETAIQLSGIVDVFEQVDRKRRQQMSRLAANGAICAIDSLTSVLLVRHGMDPATAYTRCKEFYSATGEPLVIHQTDTALHSIFFENGILRCNVQNQMLSIHGQFLTLGADMPATLIAGAAGRLIGDVIENETLTASQARVVSASRLYKRTAFELEIGESLIFA